MRTLIEISRETYGHDETAINRHSARWYEDEAGSRFVLSRCLDGIPPFFEAYGPFKPDHEGILPALKVNGRQYWGGGWTWQRALRAFCREIKATLKQTHNIRSKQ